MYNFNKTTSKKTHNFEQKRKKSKKNKKRDKVGINLCFWEPQD